MAGGFAHDFLANVLTAGEENMVKRRIEQRLIFLAATGDDTDETRIEILVHKLFEQRAGVWRVSARLEDDGVAGGDGLDERFHRQQERIIPRTHDEHDAERRRFAHAPGRHLRQRRAHVFGARVTGGVPQHVVQRALDHAGFGHSAFCGALAEIALERGGDHIFVGNDGSTQGAQRAQTAFHIEGCAAVKIGALIGN